MNEKLKEKNWKIENLLVPFISTFIARTVFHPIDTIKTNLQFENNYHKINFRKINLFKGIGISVSLACPAGALYLSSFDYLKSILGNTLDPDVNHQFLVHSLAGAGAEGIASILFTPMDVLKQKMQTISSSNSTWNIIQELYHNHGIYGFYRGYFLTQMVFVPFSAIYFSAYEKSKSIYSSFRKQDLGIAASFSCSLFAASVASALTNPIDVVKTRIQIRTSISTLAVIKELYYTQGGLRAFAKGLTARIIWAAPSMSLSISLWEIGKSFLAKTR